VGVMSYCCVFECVCFVCQCSGSVLFGVRFKLNDKI